jgi:hypothetical protein
MTFVPDGILCCISATLAHHQGEHHMIVITRLQEKYGYERGGARQGRGAGGVARGERGHLAFTKL